MSRRSTCHGRWVTFSTARPIGTSTVAFSPPLVITDDQIDRCVAGLAASLP